MHRAAIQKKAEEKRIADELHRAAIQKKAELHRIYAKKKAEEKQIADELYQLAAKKKAEEKRIAAELHRLAAQKKAEEKRIAAELHRAAIQKKAEEIQDRITHVKEQPITKTHNIFNINRILRNRPPTNRDVKQVEIRRNITNAPKLEAVHNAEEIRLAEEAWQAELWWRDKALIKGQKSIEDLQCEEADPEECTQVENELLKLMNVDAVFYHIEKCAGSSLRVMLYRYFKHIFNASEIYVPLDDNIIPNFSRSNLNDINAFIDIRKIKVILSHTSITDLYNPVRIKITCIRNPFERIISHYYFFDYNTTKKELYDMEYNELRDYFVLYGSLICKRMGCLDKNKHTTIESIRDSIRSMDFILLVEQLDEDLNILNNELNKIYNVNKKIKSEILNITPYDYRIHISKLKLILKDITMYDDMFYQEVLLMRKNGERLL